MKQIVVILLLLAFKQSTAQSYIEHQSTNQLSSIKNLSSYSQALNNEYPTPINSNKNSKINSTINLLGIKRNDNFNLLKIQSMSFTWAEMKFYFQLDLFSTVGGMMQELNLIQIQNQFSK